MLEWMQLTFLTDTNIWTLTSELILISVCIYSYNIHSCQHSYEVIVIVCPVPFMNFRSAG